MNLEQKFDWKIQKLERAWQQEPLDAELQLKLAEAYFQKGYYLGRGEEWFDRAIERVSEALELGLVTSESCTLLANALYGRQDYPGAGDAYRRALEIDPRNALAHVGLGNLEKRRGDFRKARECYERAVEITPTLWQAHYNLGGAYYQEARAKGFQQTDTLLEKAIFHLIKALRLKPFENFIPNIQKDLGELFLHTRQYAHARKFFTRLTGHERYAPLAHYYLGLTNYSLGKYSAAIQSYRTFLKHEPKSALAWSKIGLAYLELKEYHRARESCQQALALEPDNVLAWFTTGCTWLDERKYPEAQQSFEKVLSVAPDYFPAYVELVRTYFQAKNYDWLYAALQEEVKAFELAEGYDGGRSYYQGEKGAHRRRLDVLLAQLRELGSRAYPSLLGLLENVQTDSLRFQLWEDICLLARRAKLDEVLQKLKEPEYHFSRDLGRTVLILSQYLPTEPIMQAFQAEDEQLKRGALHRLKVRDDIPEYLKALERTKAEFQEFQGYLLRALAVKGTPEAEAFLSEALARPERALRLSAAVALVYYGNERAIELLEQECAWLEGPERERVEGLIRLGRERNTEVSKVIRLTDLYDRGRPREPSHPRREDPRAHPTSCAVCNKSQREVERMLAGAKIMICTTCVRDFWRDRDTLRLTDPRDIYCSFCRKSVFEVDAFYARRHVAICNVCLDLCMGVLEKEEVNSFLQDFS